MALEVPDGPRASLFADVHDDLVERQKDGEDDEADDGAHHADHDRLDHRQHGFDCVDDLAVVIVREADEHCGEIADGFTDADDAGDKGREEPMFLHGRTDGDTRLEIFGNDIYHFTAEERVVDEIRQDVERLLDADARLRHDAPGAAEARDKQFPVEVANQGHRGKLRSML